LQASSAAPAILAVVSDVPHITVTIPSLGAASTSSATIAVSSSFNAGVAPPEQGLHAELPLSAPPAPAVALTTPLQFQHAPLDLVITAAAMGAIVAWHIRRARLDEFVRA
jgi:hypothetical protein